MLPSPLKIENAVSASDAPGASNHARYLWGGLPLAKPEGRPGIDTSLPYTRPDKLHRNESLLPTPRSPIKSTTAPADLTEDLNKDERNKMQIKTEPGETATTANCDRGGSATGDENPQSEGKTEKRKMKRFRLTHNQTRFLMSEFTRQAHPDAAHRERLSREIPGLSPRQVQVWFQNRRAKLKRLTGNDRERMLKSRALPDDFDTAQVLRSPFESKSSPENALPSPRNFISPNSNSSSLKMLLTDGLQRPNDDEYVVSPLSSASYISPATPDRNSESFPQHGALASRAPLSAPIPHMHRNGQDPFPYSRSNSCSDACAQPSPFGHGLHQHDRFSRTNSESLGHPGMPNIRRAMDYGINRPPSAVVGGYDGTNQHLDSPVSPTGPGNAPVPYNMHSSNAQVQGYQPQLTMPAAKPIDGMEMNTHIQPHNRHLSGLHSVPVSDSHYRPLSYHHSYTLNATMTFAQPNASTMSLPASFRPSDAGNAAPQNNVYSQTDERINNPQIVDPSRNNQPFEYSNYL